jgi:hypothetical protein
MAILAFIQIQDFPTDMISHSLTILPGISCIYSRISKIDISTTIGYRLKIIEVSVLVSKNYKLSKKIL